MRKLLILLAMAGLCLFHYSCSDDSDSGNEEVDNAKTAKYDEADFVGKWASNAYMVDVYVQLNADGTGSMADPNEDVTEISSWEIGTIETTAPDSLGNYVSVETPAVIITDEEDLSYELLIVESADTVSYLMDITNYIYYKPTFSTGDSSDDSDDDSDDETDDSDSTAVKTYSVDDVARKWASDDYIDDVYVLLKSDMTGTMTETDGTANKITWEFTEVEQANLDTVTGEIVYSYVAGVKAIDPQGYYTELTIIERNDTIIALKDETNTITYDRIKMETDEETKVFSIPGRIEMEDYTNGGEGVAYHASYPGGGEKYGRMGGVDILSKSSASNGFVVAPAQSGGEWIKYAVNVKEAGIYAVKVQYYCGWVGSTPMTISVSAGNTTATTLVENNSNTLTEYTCTNYVYLSTSTDTIEVSFADWANVKIDYIELTNDGVESQYSVDDFAGTKFVAADGGSVDFPESKFGQSGSCNMGDDYISVNYDNMFTDVVKVNHMGNNEAGDYNYHIGEFLIVDAGSGTEGLGAVFEIISKDELLYLGNINAYQNFDDMPELNQENYASYDKAPITMTKE